MNSSQQTRLLNTYCDALKYNINASPPVGLSPEAARAAQRLYSIGRSFSVDPQMLTCTRRNLLTHFAMTPDFARPKLSARIGIRVLSKPSKIQPLTLSAYGLVAPMLVLILILAALGKGNSNQHSREEFARMDFPTFSYAEAFTVERIYNASSSMNHVVGPRYQAIRVWPFAENNKGATWERLATTWQIGDDNAESIKISSDRLHVELFIDRDVRFAGGAGGGGQIMMVPKSLSLELEQSVMPAVAVQVGNVRVAGQGRYLDNIPVRHYDAALPLRSPSTAGKWARDIRYYLESYATWLNQSSIGLLRVNHSAVP